MAILLQFLMVNVMNALATHVVPLKQKMESLSVINLQETATANRTLLERTVMNVKMDFGIFSLAMDAKAVNVTPLEASTLLVIHTPDNVTANQESQA